MIRRIFILGMITFFSISFCEPLYYLSPGFRVSWDFRKHIVLSPKLSIGVFGDPDINMFFNNVTLGLKSPFGKDKGNIAMSYYIEVQGGWLGIADPGDYLTDIDPIMVSGFGLGLSLTRYNNTHYLGPKFSAFTGLIGFAIIDVEYNSYEKWKSDLGIQLALPFIKVGGDMPSL